MNDLSFLTLNKVTNNNKNDVQTKIHSDTFHHTYRWWYYINDVTLNDAPFHYAKGTHIDNEERIKWENDMYDKILDDKVYKKLNYADKEGSFRNESCDKVEPIMVKKNTLLIADTHGFHCRGITTNNGTRLAVLGSSRLDPFIF